MQSKENAAAHVNNVNFVWVKIDPSQKVLPKCLFVDPNLLSDYYAGPLIRIMKEQQRLPYEEQSNHIQPKTLAIKLGSLKLYFTFLITRRIFAGMNFTDLEMAKAKIKELLDTLKPYVRQREEDLKIYKKGNVLTPNVILKYFNSKHVADIRSRLLIDDYVPSKLEVIDVRDYLMIMICLMNATRASNLINMTVGDVEKAYQDESYPNAFCILSTRYKTSMLYGAKIIVVDQPLKTELEIFIKNYLPVLVKSRESKEKSSNNIFQTNRKSSISHSAISNGMTNSFKKANVFESCKGSMSSSRVCPTRIRMSVATEMCGIGDEKLEEFARVSFGIFVTN